MQNLLYYIICTFIWGSTYLVITYQIDSTSPMAAVFYRFLISTVILWLVSSRNWQSLRFNKAAHLRFVFQGLFLFCLNYVLIYHAEKLVPSGLIALIFMSMVYFNILGMRFVFHKPISIFVLIGALFGGIGLILVFGHEFSNSNQASQLTYGLLLGLGASLSASIGNLISYKNSVEKVSILPSNAWGMLYGSLWSLCFGLILKEDFSVHWTPQFVGALLYLSIFGTLIAFGTYLTLISRIGAEKAVYSTVISPIIALILSAYFENFNWTWSITLGTALCVIGNFLTLSGSLFQKKTPN